MVKMEEITFEEIKRIQQGEKNLFDRVMLPYKEKVAGICFKYMRSAEEAADIAQEVFTQVYCNIGKFRFQSAFSTWIYRLAVNCCINRLKSLKRRSVINNAENTRDEGQYGVEKAADEGKPVDEELELKELKAIVMEELESFPPVERSLIILKDMEGFSCDEISAILKMPVGSVKSRSARTREKVRKNLIRKMGEKLGLS